MEFKKGIEKNAPSVRALIVQKRVAAILNWRKNYNYSILQTC